MDISLQYLAGLVDGEGCIMLARMTRVPGYRAGRCKFFPVMTIANTYLPLLDSIQLVWGGRVRLEGATDTWAIYFSANQMRRLLSAIFPYLIIKRDQARLMMDYLAETKVRKSRTLTDDEYRKLEALYVRLKELKHVRFQEREGVGMLSLQHSKGSVSAPLSKE